MQGLDALRARIRGEVIAASDPGYDNARKVWNGMIDKHPLLVVNVIDEVDVQYVIRFARDYGHPLSVKGGGHNVVGHAVCDGGAMLDLGLMRAVDVDPVRRVARVQGGALWSDVDRATSAHGLATTGGVIASTGVAGLTLGGGIGWLVGKHGMAIDNLLGATIVTADGEIIETSAASHPDLFWAIRGGGGNFGVVVSFDFALHPVPDVLAGFVAWPVTDASEVMAFYRDFTISAPDELTAYAQIATDAESGERVVAIAVCWPGEPGVGAEVLAPLRDLGTPIIDMIELMPYVDWQQAFEAEFPAGRRYYWKSNLLRELDDGALEALVEHGSDSPLPGNMVAIEWYRGPMSRVAPGATAFVHRDARYQVVISSGWDDAEDDATGIGWARRIHQAVLPYSIEGNFLNFSSQDGYDGTQRVKTGYGANLDRLRLVKRMYDPTNLFNQNNNILSASMDVD
jgi:FAD/FMN-containing dehydrogenase